MGKTSADTERDMRRAMAVFKSRVLDSKNFDPATAIYRYKGSITETAIRDIAGIKSRGTLLSDDHTKLREDLKSLITGLKIKTGKIIAADPGDGGGDPIIKENTSELSRSERLAQTIAALSFRIMVLEREIASLRENEGGDVDNVTTLVGRRNSNRKRKINVQF